MEKTTSNVLPAMVAENAEPVEVPVKSGISPRRLVILAVNVHYAMEAAPAYPVKEMVL